MTFRIRHEETNVKIISFVSCLLCFHVISSFCLIAENVDEIPAWLALIFVCILIVLIAGSFLYAIEQATETVITVAVGTLTVRHLLREQQIALNALSNIQIERHQRHRRRTHSGVHFFEQRLRMTLFVCNRKPTVLTDTATAGGNGLFVTQLFVPTDPIPDDSVPLYQAYLYILSKLNRMRAD